MAQTEYYNRLKIILVEKRKTSKWLALQLKKDPTTISKWCTNSSQPSLANLYQIASILNVSVKDLLVE